MPRALVTWSSVDLQNIDWSYIFQGKGEASHEFYDRASYVVGDLSQGRIQDFKLGGGGALKKLRRAEEGAKIVQVFRVKNYDFTPICFLQF